MTKADYILKAMRLAIDCCNAANDHANLKRIDDALEALEGHLTEKLDELLLEAYAEGRNDGYAESNALRAAAKEAGY